MTTDETPIDKPKKNNCLYIRYRKSKLPSREEVRKLHRNIIDVRFPRQKSARFCHIEFENEEAAQEALKDVLEKHSKEVIVKKYASHNERLLSKKKPSVDKDSLAKQDSSKETEEEISIDPSNCLHVSGLPVMASEQVLQSLFAKSTEITVGKNKRFGLVNFASVEDATKAMENSKGVSVNGEVLVVKFHKC